MVVVAARARYAISNKDVRSLDEPLVFVVDYHDSFQC